MLVGFSSVFATKSGDDTESSVLGTVAGIVMISLSLIVQSTQFVYQEKILSSYEVPPQRIVGLEGMFGMIFMFNWLMIFTFLPCPSPDLCQVKFSIFDNLDGRTVRRSYCGHHRNIRGLEAYALV